MSRPLRAGRASLFALATLLLLLPTVTSGPLSGADGRGAAPSGWDRKLDPFLRRIALGTTRSNGRFRSHVPRGSAEAARALPSFLQVDRTGGNVVHLKAGLRDGVS